MPKRTQPAADSLPLLTEDGATEVAPEAEISSGTLRARLYLPDANQGFYRGTRFDWAGVIADLEYAGHHYFPQWFQRRSSEIRDFIYDGDDIVAGPCAAITGPVEEFSCNQKAHGFDEARAGGTFVKIGVGVLYRPDDRDYDLCRLYPIKDGGQWTIKRQPDWIEFIHELTDPDSGYAYRYHKTVSLSDDPPRLVLAHRLYNTGQRVIQAQVYNHNFLYLDRQAPGPDCTVKVPFLIDVTMPPTGDLAQISDKQITFTQTLAGEDRVYLEFKGFGPEASDYDIQIDHRRLGAGLRITADRPMAKAAFWAIRAPLCVEPFIDMTIAVGTEFTWHIQYEFYKTS